MSSIPDIKALGRYEIVSKLGEGGMGIVYKTVDSFLGRTIALKVAKISSMGLAKPDKNSLDQCLKEARLAAQFIHPNIVITHDAGVDKDLFYMAIEYIDGSGLHKHTRKTDLLPRIQVLEIIFNICYALDHIHNKGYIHLDIKPSNIMLTKMGEVKLMDFGIARFLKDKPNDTKISGSSYYMSPEQTNPDITLNRQTDIYSLGVVLYELLAGRRPFEGDNLYQILYKIVHEGPPPIEKYVPDISPELEAIIKKAISKNRENRFKTAKEFADALLPIIKGKDSKALDKQDKKKIAYLKRLDFFKHFQYSDLAEVIKISTWSSHKSNTWIIEESDNDSNIYILVSGNASLHLGGEVKVFKKADCFGESAILYSMPRHAKVMADTDSVVISINANILNQSKDSLQVKFLKEFYKNKTLQLVDANLKLIQAGL
ncbi:MAG: protein kinase [Deltaproteobacteria bacterium]|nr:protein kinase [Deltaproteobacteria bacterium]MBW2331416.1 protein kinase [Deltaproteobacteria bacterium]